MYQGGHHRRRHTGTECLWGGMQMSPKVAWRRQCRRVGGGRKGGDRAVGNVGTDGHRTPLGQRDGARATRLAMITVTAMIIITNLSACEGLALAPVSLISLVGRKTSQTISNTGTAATRHPHCTPQRRRRSPFDALARPAKTSRRCCLRSAWKRWCWQCYPESLQCYPESSAIQRRSCATCETSRRCCLRSAWKRWC